MSAHTEPRFWKLDAFAGWSADSSLCSGIAGLSDEAGLRLADAPPQPGASDLGQFMPPPWMARGARPGEWWFLSADGRRVLSRRCCESEVVDATPPFPQFQGAHAIAVWQGWLAVAVGDEVLLWDSTGRPAARITHLAKNQSTRIAFAPWRELFIAQLDGGASQIGRFSLAGKWRETITKTEDCRTKATAALPAPVDRIGFGADRALWFAVPSLGDAFNVFRLMPKVTPADPPTVCEELLTWHTERVSRDDSTLEETLSRLQKGFPRWLTRSAKDGFCQTDVGPDGQSREHCYRRTDGSVVGAESLFPSVPPASSATGQFKSQALHSFLPSCQWHRLRVDVNVPPGTSVVVKLATSEQDKRDQVHDDDWITYSGNDFLIDQQPGRYLFVDVVLTGNVKATPRIRGIRIDFPRVTSLDRLPTIYSDDPVASDFTERFLSLFDASQEDLDRLVERFPALLEPMQAPESVLPWLADLLGVRLQSAWSADVRRQMIRDAALAARQRGTIAGLQTALKTIAGQATGQNDELVQVREGGREQPWGAVRRSAVLRSVRLSPTSTARFRLGRSAVGKGALRGATSPDDPAVYRVNVTISGSAVSGMAAVRDVIQDLTPAQIAADVRIADDGLIVGLRSTLGIDTELTGLRQPILGKTGGALLNRDMVLLPRNEDRSPGLSVGIARVGVTTVLE